MPTQSYGNFGLTVRCPGAEAIKKFAIVPGELTEAGGQLTPTFKVRRNVVTRQYAAQIAALYGEGPSGAS